jgi:transposase InsO family protein
MVLHANAALSLKKRLVLCQRVVEQRWTLTKAAEAAEVSVRTARKWVRRYRAEGEAGLIDRSSTPARQPTRTSEDRVQAIAALRRLRMTGAQIAEVLAMPLSTVSGILTRIGLGKLSRLEPPEPPNRYQRRHPGELIHVDVKKLGRIQGGAGHRVTGRKHTYTGRDRKRHVGWEYVRVCVDDATRLAYVEVLADEKASTAIGFLRRALAFYRAHGITVQRVMTDNGPAYVSLAHTLACRALGLRHLRTRPYRPRTNGKAERFIRTLLAGWAYGAIYASSQQRTAALSVWLDHYNYRRPHGALSHQPPAARLAQLTGNNLHGSYT